MKLLTLLFFSATAGLLGLVAAYEPPTFQSAIRDLSTRTFSARDVAWADQVEARGIERYAQDLLQARGFDVDNVLKSRDVTDTTLDGRDLVELEPRFIGVIIAAIAKSVEKAKARRKAKALAKAQGRSLKSRDVADTTLDARDLVELEPRFVGAALKAVAKGIELIVEHIRKAVEQDKVERSKFTVELTNRFRVKYPHYNVVVVHTKHHFNFSGQKGKDWSQAHENFPARIGGKIGYEIYWFKSGNFVLDGDGGFINWSYAGNVKSRNGKTVIFNPA